MRSMQKNKMMQAVNVKWVLDKGENKWLNDLLPPQRDRE